MLESLNAIGGDEWTVNFDATTVAFGADVIDRLGEFTRALGCRQVLMVTDPGLREAGHVDRAVRVLDREGIRVALFDGVPENPTTRHVADGLQVAERERIDGFIGLGGGSSMDCAKAINFLLTNGGRMEDYWGSEKATRPMLPGIGVPTTAGTGSDAQSYTLISQEESGTKMACGDRKAKFRVVLLDPTLAGSAPRKVVATSGLDAATHVIESYVSRGRNPISQLLGREAWRLLDASLEEVIGGSTDLKVWGRMLIASHLAGAAIEHSMLGAAHACANPLTARFGVIHGLAVSLMLPSVMEFNDPEVGGLYGELLQSAGGSARSLCDRFLRMRATAGLPGRLRDFGVPSDCLDAMADDAAKQWTAGFNPRGVGRDDLLKFYESAY